MGVHPTKPKPPIRRVMTLSTGATLEWMSREDGGLDLEYDTIHVSLTAEEFGWFMDDLRAVKPADPVYRTGGRIPSVVREALLREDCDRSPCSCGMHPDRT